MTFSQGFFERLKFEPKLRESWIGRYFRRPRAVILITVTLILAGIGTYISLKKELNPDVQIPTVIISTLYPGAGPEDIEDLISVPIEDAVSGLSGVTKVTSNSQENDSLVIVEFASTIKPEKAKSDTQEAVDKITDLPNDSKKSTVTVLDITDQPILLFALSAPGNESALPKIADDLEDRIKALSTVQKVTVNYRRTPEVSLTTSPETLASNGIDVPTLSQIVNTALGSFPAGNISTDASFLALDQKKGVTSLEELRRYPISIHGRILPLDSIVQITEREDPNTPPAFYSNHEIKPTRAIFFGVYQTDNADTRDTVTQTKAVLETYQKETSVPFTVGYYFDGAAEIERSFSQLQRDFTVTFLLVFIVLLIFFGIRQSIVAALAIPFTFLVTFLVMKAVGISINFISLFSLLLALGVLVDNAIVVISAIANYHRSGKFTPYETAVLVFRDFHGVIATTTITTVWAFIPLLLSTGIIGEFIKPIPIVVSSALAISAAVALFLVIPYMAIFLEGKFPRRVLILGQIALFAIMGTALFFLIPAGQMKFILFSLALLLLFLIGKLSHSFFRSVPLWHSSRLGIFWDKFRDRGFVSFDRLSVWYAHLIDRILSSQRARRLTLVFLIVFMIFSYTLVPAGYVVNEFFPNDDVDLVYVSVEMSIGTSRDSALTAAKELMPRFQSIPELDFVVAELGASAPTDNNTSTTGKDFGHILFTVHLIKTKERDRTSGEIVTALNHEFADWNGGTITASQLSGGPPAGADLQLKLLGNDLDTIQALAEKTKAHLETTPGVSNVTISLSSAGKKLSFHGNDATLTAMGISPFDTATLLRTVGSGYTIKEDSRFTGEKRDVVIRFSQTDFSQPEDLNRLSLRSRDGKLVPLLSLGNMTLEKNPTLITREDGQRSISVSASVNDGYSVTNLNKNLEHYADTELKLPTGYHWKTGGVNDENNKSVTSIMYAMILSAILIFATMAIQFNSYRKALIVLLVIPIAVSGVFVLFALFGVPLSFPALIGVLALFGIVVNNSIIMVDKINKNLNLGLPVREAVVEGAASRLEPILLTALTTIVGLIPITLSDPIWLGLGSAIIAGLSFSGIAKLFFIPVIYEMWFDDSVGKKTNSAPLSTESIRTASL